MRLSDLISDEKLIPDPEQEEHMDAKEELELWQYRYDKFRAFIEHGLHPFHIPVDERNGYATNKMPKLKFLFIPTLARLPEEVRKLVLIFSHKGYHKVGKFTNPTKPAISLTFSIEHKYYVYKKLKPEKIKEYLRQVIKKTAPGEEEHEQAYELLHNMNDYNFCVSNYEKFYKYDKVHFRYLTPKAVANGRFPYAYTHLSKRRLNIIFVEPDWITSHTPNMHKEVEKDLDSFPIKLASGLYVTFLYAKPKE